MAKLLGFKIPQQFMAGAILGVFSPILVWLVSFIEPLAQFLGGNVGVTNTIGMKVNQLLAGTFIQFPDILISAISGGFLVMLGTWIYNMKWSPDEVPFFLGGKLEKITLVLFYASVAVTIVLALPMFEIPALSTILVMAVNSLITAWFLVTVLGKQLKLV